MLPLRHFPLLSLIALALAACKGSPTLAADAPWSPPRAPEVSPGEEQSYDLSLFDAAARPCPAPPTAPIYHCAPVPQSAKTCKGDKGLYYHPFQDRIPMISDRFGLEA